MSRYVRATGALRALTQASGGQWISIIATQAYRELLEEFLADAAAST